MKIYAFHFAGGNKYSFNKILPEQCIGIEIPREANISFEKFILLNAEKILSLKKDKENYVLFGHSMGALVAFMVCHKLKETKHKLPEKLVISGKKSPSLLRENLFSHLPDDIFWREIVNMGGIPEEINNYPEFIKYFLPILRYDFKLTESYQYTRKSKLNIPIDIFYGSEEAYETDMKGWQNETTGQVTITELSGNHFFIFNHTDYFINYFENLLKEATC